MKTRAILQLLVTVPMLCAAPIVGASPQQMLLVAPPGFQAQVPGGSYINNRRSNGQGMVPGGVFLSGF